MGYVTGDIISKGEYNTFATGAVDGTYDPYVPNVGCIWGPGFGRIGYGQDLRYISPVVQGQLIRAQDWDNLDAVLSNIVDHQLGPGNYGIPSTVEPGQLVTPISRIAPGIQLAINGIGKCFAPNLSTEKVTEGHDVWGGPGRRKLKFTQTLTFTTADHARWFFNAGGQLRLTFSVTPTTADQYSAVWENITQSAGIITIGYRSTTRKSSLATAGSYDILAPGAGGYWANSTGVTKEHFRQRANSGGYADSDADGFLGTHISDYYGYYGYGYGYGYYGNSNTYMKVELTVSDSDGIPYNTGKTVSVITTFVQDPGSPPIGDVISASFRVGMTIAKPTVDFLPVDHWSSFYFTDSHDVMP